MVGPNYLSYKFLVSIDKALFNEVIFVITIAVILTFLGVAGLVYFCSAAWPSRNQLIKTRLERFNPAVSISNQLDAALERPLAVRLFEPLVVRLSGFIVKFTPLRVCRNTENLLESAGCPGNLKVRDYLVIKMIVSIGIPLLVYSAAGSANPQTVFFITAASFLLAVILPDFTLKRLGSIRRQKIIASLPDNLDLLTVSVEAGLGFDQALLKLVEKTKGPLTEEFKRVLQEIRIGKTRRDALREMSVRTGVEDLQNFVAALIQADQLGVGIGNVLRIQSQQLRQKRRLKAEEKAQKAPVKMLIPMIIFIFPSLFIILLGPGILQLIDNFTRMK